MPPFKGRPRRIMAAYWLYLGSILKIDQKSKSQSHTLVPWYDDNFAATEGSLNTAWHGFRSILVCFDCIVKGGWKPNCHNKVSEYINQYFRCLHPCSRLFRVLFKPWKPEPRVSLTHVLASILLFLLKYGSARKMCQRKNYESSLPKPALSYLLQTIAIAASLGSSCRWTSAL